MALGLAASASAEPTIRFAEPVNLATKGGAGSFDAYGRRFSFNLVDNERVLQKLPAQRKQQLARYRLLRGSLDGAPGSWVRLTESSRGVEGAIWDGRELYAVARYESIEPFLTTPLEAAPGQTVVYRLSDARDALPRDFCDLGGDTAEAQVSGLDQYRALVTEIQGGIVTPMVTSQLEIALLADAAFQQAEHDPTAAMMARLNVVEGIFSEQLGLLILATDVRLMPTDADPFTTTDGGKLLEQLGAYREATAAVRARGLAHLMTGKDLDGTTAGIAYVGTVCDVKRGVSVSQRSYGTTISALIMAHELGHNLGAEHDGVAGKSCANVGDGFIMAPSVSGYSTFSECSLASMRAVLSAASCVKAAEFADVALTADATAVAGEAGRLVTLPFTVTSKGNLTAEGVEVKVALPAISAATVVSASTTLGSCSASGTTASCQLGAMAEDETAQITVLALGNAAGNFQVLANLESVNDRLASNDRAVLPVTLRSGIDAAVTLSATATEFAVGAPLELAVDVSARRALPVHNATLTLNLNQPVSGATLSGGHCAVKPTSLSCVIEEIAPGTTRRLIVAAEARNPGPLFANVTVNVAGDGDAHNNASSLNGWVQAERDVELSGPVGVAQLDVGAIHDIPFTLRSRGTAPTGNVALLISLPGASVIVDALEGDGATCGARTENLLRCELGVLAPYATREVRLRLHGSAPVTGDLVASAVTADDGYIANNNANVGLRIDHEVDVAVVLASGGTGLEDVPFEGEVTLRSQGRQAAVGAELDIDLHAAGVLRSARIHQDAACELLSVTRARCKLAHVARNAQVHVSYEAVFAEPGEYAVTFTARTPRDTGADNDVLVRAVIVRPQIDAAVSGALAMELLGGQSRTRTVTLTAGPRALPSARLTAGHVGPALRVESIAAPGAECRIDDVLGGICDFGPLEAGASRDVSVTYRAGEGAAVVRPVVTASTPGDVIASNDSLSARVEIFAATDVRPRVAGSLAGMSGAVLTFPLVEIVNGANPALLPWVEVELPAGIALVDVSAGDALCSGTSTLRCEFPNLDTGTAASLSLTVRAANAGRFTSQVRTGASNDDNPANDVREVTLEIAAEPAQPAPSAGTGATGSSGNGKSGGGGRMEWLALLMLAGLVAARLRPTLAPALVARGRRRSRENVCG